MRKWKHLFVIGTVIAGLLAMLSVPAQPSADAAAEAAAAEAAVVEAAAQAQAAAEVEAEAAARAQLEAAELRLEEARAQLEEAAREIAIRPTPGTYVLAGGPAGMRARFGAVLVDAEDGALVTRVVPNGDADDAGLVVGDMILSIDGVGLADGEETPSARLRGRLDEVEPGEAVRLVVERGGETRNLSVETTRGERGLSVVGTNLSVLSDESGGLSRLITSVMEPGRIEAVGPNAGTVRLLNFTQPPWGDMELVAMTEGLGRYFGTTEGLLVVRGPGDEAIGIEEGDVILAISGRTPNSPQHAIRILGSFEPGETIGFSIMRDGGRETVEYLVPEA